MNSSDTVAKVPIHHAPAESPRKKRGRPPKNVENVVTDPPKEAVPGDKHDGPTVRRGHTLDFSPVHSKIVKTDKGAVIVEPPGVPHFLPLGDEAHKLPVGAKIEKLNEGNYRSTQLDAQFDAPPTLHETAIEAIAMFTAHFWPTGV